MQQSTAREKVSPTWASKKGRHPTQDTIAESRRHWSKVFFIKGKRAGKRVAKKFRRFTRETIRRHCWPE